MSTNIIIYQDELLPSNTSFNDGQAYKAITIKQFCEIYNISCSDRLYDVDVDGKRGTKITKENRDDILKKYNLTKFTNKFIFPEIDFAKDSHKSDIPPEWVVIDVDEHIPTPRFCSHLPFTISKSGKRHYYAKTGVIEHLQNIKGVDVFLHFKGDLLTRIVERVSGFVYLPHGCGLPEMNATNLLPWLIFSNLKSGKKYQKEFEEIEPMSEEDSDGIDLPHLYRKIYFCLKDYSDDYENWRNVLLATPFNDDLKHEFHHFSKYCHSKYNENQVESQWKGSGTNRWKGGLSWLLRQVKLNDPQLYDEISGELKLNKKNTILCGTNVSFGKLFYSLCKSKLVYKNGSWFKLTPIGRWIECDKKNNGLINAFYDSVKPVVDKLYSEVQKEDDELKAAKDIFGRIQSVKFQKDVITYSTALFEKSDLEFDSNPYLIGFNNGVWDFKAEPKMFRKYKPEDYMTLSVGYDWEEKEAIDETKNKMLNDLIKQILQSDEIVNFWKKTLGRCLIGINSQTFIILNGTGGNGKGILCDGLGSATFGDYAYNFPISSLCEGRKSGANTEIALCSNKRFIFSKEPPNHKKMDNSTIKELTGGGTVNARVIYSSDTKTNLTGTLFMETNPKIAFVEEPSDAEIRRVRLIPFNSKYVCEADEIDEQNNTFLQNPEYTTPEWKNEYKLVYFNIIKNALLEGDDLLKVEVPHIIKEKTKSYLSRGIQLLDFITDEFDILNSDEVKEQKENGEHVLSLLQFTTMFKSSDYYSLLNREDKAGIKKHIEELFTTNSFCKKYFVERFHIKDGKDIRKAIVGLRQKKHQEIEL